MSQGVEGYAVGGGGEAFEASVVAAARFRIGRYEGAFGVIDWRAVCAKGDGAVAGGEKSERGLDGCEEFSGAGESVDVGAVFVTDPV